MASRLKRRSSHGFMHKGVTESALDTSVPVIEDTFVDDEGERRARMRVQKRQSIGYNKSRNSSDDNLVNVVAGLSAAQLTEHYSNCMKLSAENKISVKNAFNLQLIDYMSEMMRKKQSDLDNFQAASVALDASAKIYAYRVDSVHSDTLKLAGGVGSSAAGPEKKQTGDADDDEPRDDDPGDDNKKNKPRKRNRATVEKNLKNITCTKFDLEFDVDPLFKKTSAQFDSGGGGGQFLASLHMRDESCELLLDSNAFLPTSFDYSPSQEENASNDDVLVSDLLPPTFEPSNLICETMSTFGFKDWSPEQEDGLNLSRAIEPDSIVNEDDEHVFDAAAPMNDDPLDDFDPIGGAGFDGDGLMDDDEGGDAPAVAEGNNLAMGMKVMDVQQLREHLAAVPTEYSYFDTGRLGAWAGPQHWKFKPVSRMAVDDEERRKQRKKDKAHMNFEDLLNSSGSLTLDRVQKNMKPPKRPLQLQNKTMKNWSEEKATMPEDLHYSGKDFVKLECMIDANVAPGAASKDSQDVDVDDYDFDNPNDTENFCPPAAENDPSDGYAMDEDNTMATVFSQDGSLISAPNKVEKIQIGYAKQAKKMDMRKLKLVEWDILKSIDNKENKNTNAADETPMKAPPPPDNVQNPVAFSDLYKELNAPFKLPTKMQENLSVPLAFVALLHLCNERTLRLNEGENLKDFVIEQG